MPFTQGQIPELLVRGSAVGVFILLALALVQGSRAPSRLTGGMFCLAAAAHTLTQSDTAFHSLGAITAPIWVLSVMGAGLFWAFALALFGDETQLASWRFIPAGILLAIGAIHAFLIWAGDILMLYALLGFTMPWFARQSHRGLVRSALILLAVPTALTPCESSWRPASVSRALGAGLVTLPARAGGKGQRRY